MDEPAVFESVLDEVEARGFEPLVHIPAAHEHQYRAVLDRCPSHHISIRGRYPDVVGFTNTNRIFSIEVKGDADLQKGLGQALTYQQGSHYAYLAADGRAIEEVANLAISSGLGVIGVSNTGTVDWQTPNQTLSRDLIPDVEGQLTYRLRRRESAGKIASMHLAQPLNFLAPVVAIATVDTPTENTVADTIAGDDGYALSATNGAISGAKVLGLVDATSDELQLTSQGEIAAAVLRGCGIPTLTDLKQVKDSIPRRGTVYEHYPTLATLLRNVLLQHPEMRLLVEALSKFDNDTIHLPDLIERLVRQYPNVFLNLFCTGQGRETARELIENGSMETLYMDDDTWRDVIRTNIVFNFTHQLRHAGILASDTVGHGSAFAEYDSDAKPWHLNRQTLREL